MHNKGETGKLIQFIPPIARNFVNSLLRRNISFSGPYGSWNEAVSNSSGYNSEEIFEKVKQSALLVKEGKAAYERDSVAFSEVSYSLPLVACLLRIASAKRGNMTILDYGGSLGSTYYQNRDMLSGIPELTWCIVEQRKIVDYGKEFFEDNNLKFYYSIKDCLLSYNADVIILSSVLQYLEKPYELLNEACINNFQYIIIDRTPCHSGNDDILTIQKTPASIYRASYPSWIFNCNMLINSLNDYELLYEFDAIDGRIISGKFSVNYKGYFLKLCRG